MKTLNKMILISISFLSLMGCDGLGGDRDYQVEFVNYDYSSLETCVVKHGEKPIYTKEEPVKYDYEESIFAGWTINGKFYSKDTSLPKIKKDTLIVASFNKTKQRDWVDERDFTYINVLDKPTDHVSNLTELSNIVDYYAFYKVEEFDVYLTDEYEYTFEDKDIDKEICALYWYGDLVNTFMGVNAKKTDENCLHFVFTFYPQACEFLGYEEAITFTNVAKIDTDISSSRAATYNNFASEDSSLKLCDVYTTNQLYYAIEFGYKPNCIKNSPAEKYYQKCKDLLIQLVNENDSKETKISKIYDYINSTCQYDYSTEDISMGPDPVRYPDYCCALNKSFYLEGYFDNHFCVCNAYSILFTTLLKMEGIEIRRISACQTGELGTKEIAGHAFNYIKHDNGKWYYYDLTFGNQIFDMGGTPVYMNLHYTYAACPSNIIEGMLYSLNDVEFDITDSNDYYYYENHYLTYGSNDKVDLYISSNSEAEAAAYAINESLVNQYSYVEFVFEDLALENTTLNLLSTLSDNIHALGISDEIIFYRSR